MRIRAAVVAVAYLGVILYLSLSPWHFNARPSVPWLQWDLGGSARREVLDAVLNVGFYVPLGVAVSCLFRRRTAAILSATAIGGVISFGVEVAQMYLPHRDPSYVDLCTNISGSLIGALVGWAWFGREARGWPHGQWRTWRVTPTGALLAALWIAAQTFPFMPVFRLDRAAEGLRRVLSPPVIPSEIALGFVALFALAQVIDGLGWLWFAVAALPAQLLIVHRMMSPVEIAAALAGLLVGRAIRGRAAPRVTAGVLLAWLAWEELRPFHFGAVQPFHWLPFDGLMTGAPDEYGATILLKLFLYGTVVWSLRACRASWARSVGLAGALLAIGESVQRYLPDRTPETTDLVLLIVAAVFVRAAESAAERQREPGPVVGAMTPEHPVV